MDDAALLDENRVVFELTDAGVNRVRRFLHGWKEAVPGKQRSADLVGEFYELLGELDVRWWDLSDPMAVNRIGTLARFTELLADYESVRRRARPDADVAGEQVGGQDRGDWYYRNLAIHIVNYAQGALRELRRRGRLRAERRRPHDDAPGEGLEWPVVFVPSMTAKRFPSTRTGQQRDWLVPGDRFAASRYEGSDADERRPFYVAMTRARDWVSMSRHDRG